QREVSCRRRGACRHRTLPRAARAPTLQRLAESLRGRRLGGHEEEARRPGGAGLAVRPTGALEAHPDLARQLVLEGAVDAEPPRGRVEPQHVGAMVAVLAVAGNVP